MKKYYNISTAYGNHYKLDKDGYVLEYSNGLKENENSNSRKTWQITGAWYNIGFGHIRTMTLDELHKIATHSGTIGCGIGRCNLKLSNGFPKYGLTDIDHGTRRLHGNKNVHGISSISITNY